MKTLLRGLPVLLFCSLLPRLDAALLTFSQTVGGLATNYQTNAWGGSLGFAGAITLFDPGLGTLERVSLSVRTTANVNTYEFNGLAQAITYMPNVALLTSVTYPGTTLRVGDKAEIQSGSPVVLQPGETSPVFTATFINLLEKDLSDPSQLAFFQGVGTKTMDVRQQYDGLTGNGLVSATGTVNLTMTYHYHQASEAGPSLALMAPLLLLALWGRRRTA